MTLVDDAVFRNVLRKSFSIGIHEDVTARFDVKTFLPQFEVWSVNSECKTILGDREHAERPSRDLNKHRWLLH